MRADGTTFHSRCTLVGTTDLEGTVGFEVEPVMSGVGPTFEMVTGGYQDLTILSDSKFLFWMTLFSKGNRGYYVHQPPCQGYDSAECCEM